MPCLLFLLGLFLNGLPGLLLFNFLFLDRNGLLQGVRGEILGHQLLGSGLAAALLILAEIGIHVVLVQDLCLTLAVNDSRDRILSGILALVELEDLGLLHIHAFWHRILRVVDVPASLLPFSLLLLLLFLNLFLFLFFHGFVLHLFNVIF